MLCTPKSCALSHRAQQNIQKVDCNEIDAERERCLRAPPEVLLGAEIYVHTQFELSVHSGIGPDADTKHELYFENSRREDGNLQRLDQNGKREPESSFLPEQYSSHQCQNGYRAECAEQQYI